MTDLLRPNAEPFQHNLVLHVLQHVGIDMFELLSGIEPLLLAQFVEVAVPDPGSAELEPLSFLSLLRNLFFGQLLFVAFILLFELGYGELLRCHLSLLLFLLFLFLRLSTTSLRLFLLISLKCSLRQLNVTNVQYRADCSQLWNDVGHDGLIFVDQLILESRAINDLNGIVEELELVLLERVAHQQLSLLVMLEHGQDFVAQVIVLLDVVPDQKSAILEHSVQLITDILQAVLQRFQIMAEARDVLPVRNLQRLKHLPDVESFLDGSVTVQFEDFADCCESVNELLFKGLEAEGGYLVLRVFEHLLDEAKGAVSLNEVPQRRHGCRVNGLHLVVVL